MAVDGRSRAEPSHRFVLILPALSLHFCIVFSVWVDDGLFPFPFRFLKKSQYQPFAIFCPFFQN